MSHAIYFFDLETTGLLKHNGRIIEIACCKMVYEPNGKFYSTAGYCSDTELKKFNPLRKFRLYGTKLKLFSRWIRQQASKSQYSSNLSAIILAEWTRFAKPLAGRLCFFLRFDDPFFTLLE